MFHLLTYRVVAGVNDANVDMTAASTDGEFTARNNHYIFTEKYDLIGAAHMAVSATRARFNVPSLNRIARFQIWPPNRSATPPADPRIYDLRNYPLTLPQDEEIAIEESNNLGAATEETTVHLWVCPSGTFKRTIPQGQARLLVRATGALARVAAAWATGGVLTFAENLLGGWYAVVGANCQSANLRAFRIVFPRWNVVAGRKLRPGGLATNAVGDLDYRGMNFLSGQWGVFHSFEPPTLDVWGDAAGADTQELRLDLVYLGAGPRDQPPMMPS